MSVDVLAAVIQMNNRYLLCRRPSHKRHGGLWEFPGGKVERHESLTETARRELREELEVMVTSVGRARFTHHDPDSPYVIHFVDVHVVGLPRPIEHSEIGWFTLAEMDCLELAPSDNAFRRTLVDGAMDTQG